VLFDFDVAVIGGGPAGSAAAITCAGLGLKTALLEAEQFPRNRAGESLHPGIERLFERLGVREAILRAGFLRYPGYIVHWNSRPELQQFGRDLHGPLLGFHAWRADLDHILLEQAKRQGAVIFQPCKAIQPILSEKRVAGLHTSIGTIRTRFVIDATGSRRWLQRKMQLEIKKASPQLIVSYGYSQAPDRGIGPIPLIISEPDGWSWAAMVKPGMVAWTRLTFSRYSRSTPQFMASFPAASPVQGADVTWRIVDECAGVGFFLAGDAACVVDPAASHGVLRAMMSGMYAGALTAEVIRGQMREQSAIAAYRRWLNQWFVEDTAKLKALYARLPVDLSAWPEGKGDRNRKSFC
jgi:flavin-dependent dehydrogenase